MHPKDNTPTFRMRLTKEEDKLRSRVKSKMALVKGMTLKKIVIDAWLEIGSK